MLGRGQLHLGYLHQTARGVAKEILEPQKRLAEEVSVFGELVGHVVVFSEPLDLVDNVRARVGDGHVMHPRFQPRGEVREGVVLLQQNDCPRVGQKGGWRREGGGAARSKD